MENLKAGHPWELLLKLANRMMAYLEGRVYQSEGKVKTTIPDIILLAKLERGRRNLRKTGAFLTNYALSPSKTRTKILEMMIQIRRDAESMDDYIITHFINRKKLLIEHPTSPLHTVPDLPEILTE
jgi:hypothetical protein